MKISDFFSLKIFIFLVINFSVYLNRHVFVMAITTKLFKGNTVTFNWDTFNVNLK